MVYFVFAVIGFVALLRFLQRVGNYANWIQDIKENTKYVKYGKVAKMKLDTLLSIYRVNPKRFRYEEGHRYGSSYLHILYNGHQEDHEYLEDVWNDWLGRPVRNRSKTVKAEDRWDDYDGIVSIILPYSSYRRFLKLVKKYNKDKETVEIKNARSAAKRKEREDTQFVLESAQADINRLREESEKQLVKGRETLVEVLKNMVQEG